jgi:hypothetical protein
MQSSVAARISRISLQLRLEYGTNNMWGLTFLSFSSSDNTPWHCAHRREIVNPAMGLAHALPQSCKASSVISIHVGTQVDTKAFYPCLSR